ncbi:MAG: PqqD family peptide modification chaperone [Desulfobulbaceae bacterium]|nr:PqqD family peptide modification chaperone [Desulfobulbaceae bacterium]
MNIDELFGQAGEQVDCLRILRSQTTVDTELEDETVILDLDAGIYSGLDAVGTRIWQLLEHEQTVAALRAVLREEYEVGVELCQQDLLVFLKSLAAQNLIEVRGGESS